MKAPIVGLAVLLGALAAACSAPPRIEVLNRSGQFIALPLERGAWGLGSREMQLPPGAFAGIALWRLPGSGLRLRAGTCEYRYDVPRLPRSPPSYPPYVVLAVQIEPDLAIHDLPAGAAEPQDISKISGEQPEGFPLAPVARRCE